MIWLYIVFSVLVLFILLKFFLKKNLGQRVVMAKVGSTSKTDFVVEYTLDNEEVKQIELVRLILNSIAKVSHVIPTNKEVYDDLILVYLKGITKSKSELKVSLQKYFPDNYTAISGNVIDQCYEYELYYKDITTRNVTIKFPKTHNDFYLTLSLLSLIQVIGSELDEKHAEILEKGIGFIYEDYSNGVVNRKSLDGLINYPNDVFVKSIMTP